MRSGCGTLTVHCTSLAGSRPAFSRPCARLYWLMLPTAPTPTFLALELAEIGQRADALVVELLA